MRGGSSGNDILENIITSNDVGIYLFEGSSNTIFHNSFIDNTIQALDEDPISENFWYHPELLRGNIWSCYIGVDFDGDGIGDTDIAWPAEGYDPYPLVTDDFDGDGMSYYGELVIGTDPNNPDTDFDGFSDGDEWRLHLTYPLVPGPFYIDGDDQLVAMAAYHGWPVSGGAIIIQGYSIDVNDADISCIEVRNIVDTYFIIRDCTLTGATGPNYNTNQPDDMVRAGIHLYKVHGAEVTNNLCFGNLEGICLNMSTSCLVNDNECYDNSYDGISAFIWSNYNEIIDNYCHDNEWDGIFIAWGSEENIISGNDCSLNGRSGITLVGWYGVYGGASYNYIFDNTCTENDDWGIAVRFWSDNNVVEDNFCKDNTFGIFLHWSSYNMFFHNELVYNSDNAEDIDSEFGNYWYHPEFLEGNIWSDYIGVDFDGDGIGDTDVPWHDLDMYPLVTDDFDNDGLSYYGELVIGTDPDNADTDFDQISDGLEWRFYFTNPLCDDSDNDLFTDYQEIFVYFTDPLTYNEPQEVTEVIDSNLEELVAEGVLKEKDISPLLRKLDAARALMDRGKLFQASQKLGDFIDQINAKINQGKLSEEEGNALIALAQGIIDALLAM
jgi:parallel beta-helix repeat protein